MEFESEERGREVETLSEGILGIEETMKEEREQDSGDGSRVNKMEKRGQFQMEDTVLFNILRDKETGCI